MKNKEPVLFLIIFGLVFAAAGLFMLSQTVISPWLNYRASQTWTPVPCYIEENELIVNRDSEGDSYKPHIRYRYEFAGVKYVSERVDFCTSSSNDKTGEMAPLKLFPLNTEQKCFVDPDEPQEAVLIRDWGRGVFKWVSIPFASIFIFTGFGVKGLGFYNSLPREHKLKRLNMTPNLLKLKNFIGPLAICLFWNGIVSAFLIIWAGTIIRDGFNSSPMITYGLGLFLTPFVAIGAKLFYDVLKEVAKLFRSSIKLSLDKSIWSTPSTQTINWELPDSYDIKKISLHLVCIEKASYSIGSSTETEEKEVKSIVFKSRVPLNTNLGQCQFKVPAKLMTSFKSQRNEISWFIKTTVKTNSREYSELYPVQLKHKGNRDV